MPREMTAGILAFLTVVCQGACKLTHREEVEHLVSHGRSQDLETQGSQLSPWLPLSTASGLVSSLTD